MARAAGLVALGKALRGGAEVARGVTKDLEEQKKEKLRLGTLARLGQRTQEGAAPRELAGLAIEGDMPGIGMQWGSQAFSAEGEENKYNRETDAKRKKLEIETNSAKNLIDQDKDFAASKRGAVFNILIESEKPDEALDQYEKFLNETKPKEEKTDDFELWKKKRDYLEKQMRNRGKGGTEKEVKGLLDVEKGFNELKSLHDKIWTGPVAGRAGRANISGKDRAAFNAKRAYILKSVARAFEGARMSDIDMTFYDKMVPDDFHTSDQFEGMQEQIVNSVNERINIFKKTGEDPGPVVGGAGAISEEDFNKMSDEEAKKFLASGGKVEGF
jgi:hypothetical protein